MPIENLSNRVRMPRLGKIHLGIKDTTTKDGHPIDYPKPTDYFVCPDEVKAVYGDEPKELDIMLPTEDPELFAPQYLKAYSLTQGLICRGNGVRANRKVDLKTGKVANSKTTAWDWQEVPCNPQECELYMKKSCRQVMNLLFLLPKVQGLGVYQIDTSSYHSIVNINSMVRLLKGIVGRCSMIPLTLVLRPQEVAPQGTTKKTVHVLDMRQNITLSELAKQALLPPAQVLMPEVTEEIPEDLYPVSKIDEEETTEKSLEKPAKPKKHSDDKDKLTQQTQTDENKDWMEDKATEEDKRSFVLKMKDLGFATKEVIREQLEKHTGKIAGWTREDLNKTLSAASFFNPFNEKEKKESSSQTSDNEIEAFLEED
ncbi:MAG: hypothetical protein JRC66_08320 [Deltaproteobacteria bacterium]|nr:hypothetical protein [Deltaproteobacteria bacterium]